MQQNERIELIKAAAMLTVAALQSKPMANCNTPTEMFDYYYDYLQLKLEASSGDTTSKN
jgi:hypothetical protein